MFGEFKYKGKEVERGQDLYLTRIVRKYMFTGIYTWIYPKKETTVKELQDWFVQKCRFKKQYKNKH